ncbi:MAG: hypothetical protein H7259_01660 [Cytophagales bacterium]|nr:hypothetical protein [Cytophaga sp.]
MALLFINTSFINHPENAIAKGDLYFNQMRYLDAIAWYSLDSANAEAQWKIARANICIGESTDKNLKEAYFRKAEKAARACITINERNGYGHTWLAAALGTVAMYEGSKTKILLVTEIRKELDRAIALNPKDDIAYSILGSVYREIGNISWFERQLAETFIGKIPSGGYEDSEKAFKQATTLAPDIMRHWCEFGLLYEYWDKPELAKQAFLKAKACPVFLKGDHDRLIIIEEHLKNLND